MTEILHSHNSLDPRRLLLRFGNHHLCLTAGVLWTWLMCARRTPPSLPEQAYTPIPHTPPPPPSPASRQPDICPPTSYLYLRHPHHDFGQCLIRTNVRPSISPWFPCGMNRRPLAERLVSLTNGSFPLCGATKLLLWRHLVTIMPSHLMAAPFH